MKKAEFILFVLIFTSLSFTSCQKAEEPEGKKAVLAQKEETRQRPLEAGQERKPVPEKPDTLLTAKPHTQPKESEYPATQIEVKEEPQEKPKQQTFIPETSEEKKEKTEEAIVSWALRPESLPEISPGETINLNILITNNDSAKTATAVELMVYGPHRKVKNVYTKIPITLAPGQSTQIPVAVTTSLADPLGIYIIEYSLLTEGYQLLTSELVPEGVNAWVEYLLQPSNEEPSGRFVVSNPPTE